MIDTYPKKIVIKTIRLNRDLIVYHYICTVSQLKVISRNSFCDLSLNQTKARRSGIKSDVGFRVGVLVTTLCNIQCTDTLTASRWESEFSKCPRTLLLFMTKLYGLQRKRFEK